jgi:hypothetical protein
LAKKQNQEVVENVEFSYNLGSGLKIDVAAAKQNKADKEKKKLEMQKEFEELKKQMELKKDESKI